MAGLNRAYRRRGNMVANTGGPVMCLDAGSKLSYPGSGTAWTDLSGHGNTGTLTNGPTYSSANGGSIVFDGVDDTVPTVLNASGYTALSVALWFKRTTGSSGDRYAFGTHSGSTDAVFLLYVNGDDTLALYVMTPLSTAYSFRNSSATVTAGNWAYVCGVFNGGSTSLDMYVNGVLGNGILGGTGPVPASLRASSLPVSVAPPVGGVRFTGNIGQATLYNRALSAAEINTNFELSRGRYGI